MLFTDINGFKISKFTLGTVQLGKDYGMANKIGKPTYQAAQEILDTAACHGVNTLDTAVDYGDSEAVLGKYFAASGNYGFTVVSKYHGLDPDNPVVSFRRFLNGSRKALGINDIPMYFFHDPIEMVRYAPILEDELVRLRCPGASVYTTEEVERFLDYPFLKAIQVPMNAMDTRIISSGLLDELRERGIIVFVRSVFLQGLLCMDQAPEKYAFAEPHLNLLREVAQEENMTMPQLAVSFIRDLDGVSSLTLGCETAVQVADNAALLCGPALSAAARGRIIELGKSSPIEDIMRQIRSHK